jgi:hypothetical protein
MTQSPDLIHVRSRKPIDRMIDKPGEGTRFFWQFTNLFLVNALVAAAGIASTMLRRRSRNAYTMKYQKAGA